MKKRNNHILHVVFCTFILTMLFMALSVQASAASAGVTKLNVKKTYKSFDITGDKKKDTVSFKTTRGSYSYSSLKIYVNKKLAYTLSDLQRYSSYSFELKLIRLKNGKPFLYVYAPGDNGDGSCQVLQYKGGKFKKIIDLATLMKGYGSHETASVKRVSGNNVVFSVHLMSYELGAGLICDYEYKYKSGTLKRASSTAKIDKLLAGNLKSMTAYKTIKVYKKPGSKSYKFSIKKGQKVTFPQVWLKSGKLWVKVNVNGKTGWIPASKKPYALYGAKGTKRTFKEIMYAG